ncbi:MULTISPECIES: TetR/AcrR family transcriptional regulator [unclassified Parafrankia]|uniref:TetR/AcrR family transcriptional regulator n=1 Tax=unclassified Parafrankia TaxID=2994368 RepID=UPI000DA54DF0|nr:MULTISPECIES: TetR/AcrR family transcriptional regulator [unclassified Parafrankia]TCJ32076.1 TetR/AcrR family transcriptional regulator [Parafrankia sp. BMG5.11]CAI7980949.1 TetR/AcrR family transcriptional regulator, mexJK operon transcriptional repressor [Frankia sp. Hr75.2]SQD99981.1 Transcriptional regulator, TetR family [Parafrankia sp. Ea1.12]
MRSAKVAKSAAAAESAGSVGTRGRIDKRQAILDAAFAVFAREGYAQASIDMIASEAGVAKPTIYNHLGGKENLFRHAMAAAADRTTAKSLAVVSRLTADVADLPTAFTDVGRALLECYCAADSWALRRLLHAEIVRFPDLFDMIGANGPNQVGEAFADRLARLALAGRLRLADPVEAAEQFLALLTGPVAHRSALGTRPFDDTQIQHTARAATATFLRAFAAAAPTEVPPAEAP